VKRILISAALAIGIHAALLATECSWLGQFSAGRSEPRVITLDLAVQPSPTPAKMPVGKKPDASFQTPLPTKPPKPKPLKTRAPIKPLSPKTPAQSTAQEPVPSISQPPANPSVADHEPNLPQAGPLQPANENNTEAASMASTVREARPLYRLNPSPRYPFVARRRGLQGDVILEVLIDRHGNVEDLRVWKSSGHPILDRAAMDSVKKWSFVPGMRGNEPLEMWVRIPIQFELK
jgi:periplasmic protein TonB